MKFSVGTPLRSGILFSRGVIRGLGCRLDGIAGVCPRIGREGFLDLVCCVGLQGSSVRRRGFVVRALDAWVWNLDGID